MSKLKVLFNQTLMISTAILFGLGLQAFILYLTGRSEEIVWPWYIPFSIVLAGLLCSLPSLMFLSEDNIKGSGEYLKKALHFIITGLVITLMGYIFGWYSSWPQYGAIMIMYVVIYNFVWLASLWIYKKEDNDINEKIKDIQDKE